MFRVRQFISHEAGKAGYHLAWMGWVGSGRRRAPVLKAFTTCSTGRLAATAGANGTVKKKKKNEQQERAENFKDLWEEFSGFLTRKKFL